MNGPRNVNGDNIKVMGFKVNMFYAQCFQVILNFFTERMHYFCYQKFKIFYKIT